MAKKTLASIRTLWLEVEVERLRSILADAVIDYDNAKYIEDVRFDWIDAAREAIGRKPA